MRALTADVRVVVRLSDGRMAIYGCDDIDTQERLSDEIDEARRVLIEEDIYEPIPTFPASAQEFFRDTTSWVVAEVGT